MIELTGAFPPEVKLKPGDVVMVARHLVPDPPKKPWTWRYFAMIFKQKGSRFTHIILDEKEREPSPLPRPNGDEVRVWYLPEGEWPDGIWAFRTQLILTGRVEGVDQLF